MQMRYKGIVAHHSSSINSLCLVKGTEYALTGGGNDYLVKLHNVDSGNSVSLVKEHVNGVNGLDISESRKTFCSASSDSIILWDLVTQAKLRRIYSGNEDTLVRDRITDCRILQDDILVSCGANCKINFFDLRQQHRLKPIYSIRAGDDILNSLTYSPNRVVAGSSNGNTYTIDLRNQELITDSYGCGSVLNVTANSDACLVNFENGKIRLTESSDSKLLFEGAVCGYKLNYKIGSELINDYYADDVSYVLSGSQEGCIKRWKLFGDRSKAEKLEDLCPSIESGRDESKILNVVKFDELSNRLVSASGDGKLYVWENYL